MMKALAFAVAGLVAFVAAGAADKGTPDEAKAILERAIAALKADEAKALAAFNDPKGGFVDRDLYVFCFDKDGTMTASGANPSRVGTDARTLKGPDGRAVGAEMVALAARGGESMQYKITFLKSVGGQTCGVGAYK
jgi:hypothetical protein